jgi:integrase/recombinase XerD
VSGEEELTLEEAARRLEGRKWLVSESTARFYDNLVRLMRKYKEERGDGSLEGFLAWLRERGWSPRSLKTVVYHLRSVGADLKPPRAGPAAREALSEEELRRVLEEARRRGFYHYALVALCGLCGLRVSEALSLRWADVDFEGGFIVVRAGKGAKGRRVPAPRQLLDYLRFYRGKPEARVVNRTYSWAWQAVREVGEKALGKPVSPHVLRHTYATLLLKRGVDVRTVQEVLGHASLATTAAYLHSVDLEAARRAVESLGG